MANKDLRYFLKFLEEKQQLGRVKNEADPKYEICALAEKAVEKSGPALLFENVKGHPNWRVALNLTGTRERAALILDSTPEKTAQIYLHRIANPIPCKKVGKEEAPVKERIFVGDEVNIFDIPVLTHFAHEPPFITIGIVIAKDPDTGGYNWSLHRIQVKERNKIGILISPYHLWMIQQKKEKRGEPLEVAVSLGNHPLDIIAALSMVPFEVEEPEVAGALRGDPLEVVPAETVDLDVPAWAETVIEGYIPAGVREEEGPFGEFSGYYAKVGLRHVIQVTAVTRRENPIYLANVEGGSLMSRYLEALGREGPILQACKGVTPQVKAVNRALETCWCAISMKKEREGEQKNVMAAALSIDPYIKLIIVVDEDVNVFDPKEILWAMAFRTVPERDITVIPGMWLSPLDPNSAAGTIGKVLIDATLPLSEDKSRFKRVEVPEEIAAKMRLEDYLEGWPARPYRRD